MMFLRGNAAWTPVSVGAALKPVNWKLLDIAKNSLRKKDSTFLQAAASHSQYSIFKEALLWRSALDYLRTIPGQLVETNVEADPRAEISGIYRYVGAKGTVKRPTRLGPAMIFNNVKGHPGAKVAIGILSSRARVGHLLGCEPEKQGYQ